MLFSVNSYLVQNTVFKELGVIFLVLLLKKGVHYHSFVFIFLSSTDDHSVDLRFVIDNKRTAKHLKRWEHHGYHPVQWAGQNINNKSRAVKWFARCHWSSVRSETKKGKKKESQSFDIQHY